VQAKRQDINGQCTKKDGSCKGKEVRDSLYNDMKASMYLLGNAFRINQTKAPDNLPTVQAAKAFFKEMVRMHQGILLIVLLGWCVVSLVILSFVFLFDGS
jgi:hypothetical protein